MRVGVEEEFCESLIGADLGLGSGDYYLSVLFGLAFCPF
jgi:hypothetical protein